MQILFKCHTPARKYYKTHVLLTSDKVHNPLRLPREATSARQKMVRACCFQHFDFDMCFAPQRRALFRHLNFQKWSDPGVPCIFGLLNVLRATTACTFSDIATSKSGPNLVCFVHVDLEMCFAPQRRAIFHLSSGQMAPHPPL